MAVAKSRKSRSKRDMRRRSNTKISTVHLRQDPVTGETHIAHCLTASGVYKGKKVLTEKDS